MRVNSEVPTMENVEIRLTTYIKQVIWLSLCSLGLYAMTKTQKHGRHFEPGLVRTDIASQSLVTSGAAQM